MFHVPGTYTYTHICIYIYIHCCSPLSLGLNPPKEGPFHATFGFQVYTYMHLTITDNNHMLMLSQNISNIYM